VTIPLFDVQAGFGGVKGGSREAFSAAALLAEMDRLQVAKALARIAPDDLDWDARVSNQVLFDACDASGGRLVPCPVLVPSSGGDFPKEQDQVQQALERGAGAVVLRPVLDAWSLEEWSGGKLLAALEERRVPALCPQKAVPLADVARAAAAYGGLPLVIIETDYRSHRMLGGLLECFPNVLLSIGSNYTVPYGIEHLVGLLEPRRLLFGTGVPRAEPMMAVTSLLYADLPEEDKKMIGWENLNSLIGGIRP
jgi:hypothetical protein